MKITAIAGGVGASKLLDGLSRVMPPEQISIIVNTGDDIEMFGLYIAPDLDIVTYTLAGIVNPAMGWGLAGDTFNCLEQLLRYTDDDRWFNLGDRDLGSGDDVDRPSTRTFCVIGKVDLHDLALVICSDERIDLESIRSRS